MPVILKGDFIISPVPLKWPSFACRGNELLYLSLRRQPASRRFRVRSRESCALLLRLTEQEAQKGRAHQRRDEEAEGEEVAPGKVEEEAEKRRADGGKAMSQEAAQTAHGPKGEPPEEADPDDIGQHHVSAKTDAVEEKSQVERNEVVRRDRQGKSRGL